MANVNTAFNFTNNDIYLKPGSIYNDTGLNVNPEQKDVKPKVPPVSDQFLEKKFSKLSDYQIVILRGLSGVGKTYVAINIMTGYTIISAERVAAARQLIFQNEGLTLQQALVKIDKLTSDEIKKLAFLFHERNQSNINNENFDIRQKVLENIHADACEWFKQALTSNPETKIIIDNTSIRLRERSTYYEIAKHLGIPEEKITAIDIDPFDNTSFCLALEELMAKNKVELKPSSKWPYLTFKSIYGHKQFTTRHQEGRNIVCKTLNTLLLNPLPLDYMTNRLKGYIRELDSERSATENYQDQGINSSDQRRTERLQSQNSYPKGSSDSSNWRTTKNLQPQDGYPKGSDSLNWRKK